MSNVDDYSQDEMELQEQMEEGDSQKLQQDLAGADSADLADEDAAATGAFHEQIGPADTVADADDWEAVDDPDMAEMPYPDTAAEGDAEKPK